MDSFNFFSYDTDAIDKHLNSGKALCMVLHAKIPGQLIADAINCGYVMLNEYDGEERVVVAHGCYRHPVKHFHLPDQEVVRKCAKVQALTDGIYPKNIFKAILEDPLLMVISNTLGEAQVDIFKEMFETVETEYEGETHTAIACVLYDPDYQTEGKIIAQWYEPAATV